MATATNRALGNLEATKALGEHPALVTTHESGSRIPSVKDLNNAPTGPSLMDSKVVVAPNKASQPGSNSGTDNSKNYLIIGGILIILFIVFKPGQ